MDTPRPFAPFSSLFIRDMGVARRCETVRSFLCLSLRSWVRSVKFVGKVLSVFSASDTFTHF